MYIWQRDDWTLFRWDVSRVNARLLSLRYAQGKLAGRLSALGFGVNSTAMLDTLSEDIVSSSEIEGVSLDR